tara:strand:+ start:1122 stop:1652 length:531 start_codon:yes stop_codon:yes gene_type:complete
MMAKRGRPKKKPQFPFGTIAEGADPVTPTVIKATTNLQLPTQYTRAAYGTRGPYKKKSDRPSGVRGRLPDFRYEAPGKRAEVVVRRKPERLVYTLPTGVSLLRYTGRQSKRAAGFGLRTAGKGAVYGGKYAWRRQFPKKQKETKRKKPVKFKDVVNNLGSQSIATDPLMRGSVGAA